MREIALRVPADGVEPVLDELLLIAPYGVFEVAGEGDEVELRLRGGADELPSRERVAEVAGAWLRGIEEREVPDDWARRRELDYEPVEIAGRVGIRPVWAPAARPGVIDLILAEGAFGTGAHPTTRQCVEILLGLEPSGALADLGCGSGILAIVAAKLGFSPVTALDNDERAVEATRINAEANGVALDARVADLLREDPPSARTIVANIPAPVHLQIAERLAQPPDTLVAAALRIDNVDEVIAAYAERGLDERSRRGEGAWVTLELGATPRA